MFDRLDKVTARAFKTLDTVFGGVQDNDLDTYDTLTPEDFPHLATRYGVDNTAEYIQEMERRRLKGGKNG
jgi:hypothetical protein